MDNVTYHIPFRSDILNFLLLENYSSLMQIFHSTGGKIQTQEKALASPHETPSILFPWTFQLEKDFG